MPSVDKSRHGFSGLNPRCRAQSPAASSALLSAGSSPEKLQLDLSSEKKWGAGKATGRRRACRPPRTRTPTASILAAGKRICPCQRMVRLFEKRETRFPSVSFHSRACLTRYLHTKKSSVAHAGKCPCAEHFLKEIPRFFADGPHRQPPGKRRKPPAGGVLFAASLQ